MKVQTEERMNGKTAEKASRVTPEKYLSDISKETVSVHEAFVKDCAKEIVEAARLIGASIRSGGKIIIFGNGGSAADAQHMAAELVGRMLVERRPLPAIALGTNGSNLTAIANDYAYEQVFLKQVQALARKNDVLIAISTSGNSKNVICAVEAGQRLGCKVISLTGKDGGMLARMSDIALNARLGQNSCRIQESHIFAVHSMVDLLDRFFLDE